ncbi:MAG: thiolase domain-containing protein, partial [Deinococcus sp.]|nr:thiolase domain-containing protein [Deinococcus sp.]
MPRRSPREHQVVLLGGGLSKFASDRADGSIRDWVVEAVLEALADAGVERDQIQHAISSYESDHFANQLTQGAIFHDAVGLCPKPNVRVEGGGATGGLAIRTAYAYLQAGLCDCILVCGAESCGKRVTSQTAQEIFAMSADTDWDMLVGGHFTAYYAMMIQEHMRLYGTTEEQLALVAVKNHGNARFHPLAQKPLDLTVADVLASPVIAAPYKLYDCSLLTDGAAALIMATEQWAKKNVPHYQERPAVYLAGTGCGTDFMRLGDRPRPYPGLAHFRAKQEAAQQAYVMAGIKDPRRQIQVA